MTSYATVAIFRGWFDQIPAGVAIDAKIQAVLDDATALIDGKLGFSFAGYAVAATERKFSSRGGQTLHLPYHESGSLTAVSLILANPGRPQMMSYSYTAPTPIAITGYEAEWDDHTYLWMPNGWAPGRYAATAKWGYGTAPADIVRICFEVASTLYLGSKSGQFSDVVGIQGAGQVAFERAWTNRQRDVLDSAKRKFGDVGFS